MPINYELEKQKFFETYPFKVGDQIIVPSRSNIVAKITEICPKYMRCYNIETNGKFLEYYTSNNKLFGEEWKPYIYFPVTLDEINSNPIYAPLDYEEDFKNRIIEDENRIIEDKKLISKIKTLRGNPAIYYDKKLLNGNGKSRIYIPESLQMVCEVFTNELPNGEIAKDYQEFKKSWNKENFKRVRKCNKDGDPPGSSNY